MPSINRPAIKLIPLFFVVKKPITSSLLAAEMMEKISKGAAMPIPNNTKLSRLRINEAVEVDMANKIMSEAGLQGNTIAPKKNPKIKEVK